MSFIYCHFIVVILVSGSLGLSSAAIAPINNGCFSLDPYFAFSSVISGSNGNCHDVCQLLHCTMYLTSNLSKSCLFSRFPFVLFKHLNIPFCGADSETMGEDIQVFGDKFKFSFIKWPEEMGSLVDYFPQVIVMDTANKEFYTKYVENEKLVVDSLPNAVGHQNYFQYPIIYHTPKNIDVLGNIVAFWLVEGPHFHTPVDGDRVSDFSMQTSSGTFVHYKINQSHCEITFQYSEGPVKQLIHMNRTPSLSQSQWHHIVLTDSASRRKLIIFIDGKQYELNREDVSIKMSSLSFPTAVAHVNIWGGLGELSEDLALYMARLALP